jgi:hypothetical protein
MLTILPDAEIDALISEPKNTPVGLLPLSKLIERNKHRRRDYPVTSSTGSGNEFVIAIRQSTMNVLDFSAILGYRVPGSNLIFRLRRYNGKHVHTNAIERETLSDFHIHMATERYQQRGLREDCYARVSTRHFNLDSAVRCLLEDCGFSAPAPQQSSLFGPPTSQ